MSDTLIIFAHMQNAHIHIIYIGLYGCVVAKRLPMNPRYIIHIVMNLVNLHGEIRMKSIR